jgi:hypothetical protein
LVDSTGVNTADSDSLDQAGEISHSQLREQKPTMKTVRQALSV